MMVTEMTTMVGEGRHDVRVQRNVVDNGNGQRTAVTQPTLT
jgi:hypothetical protein